ncbi:MAG: formylglycine-generating enzyme family protein, partial [Thermoguttaceae bacterium]|nr:formylglycine-generating enzyme family protein [Thermoguttaceae bacterium]
QEFIAKLNALGVAPAGLKFRLPTEAEWEYACRAWTPGPYAGSSLYELGWYAGNSGGRTHEVGTKTPNVWGLHDMHGNVWEWCEYDEKSNNARNPIDEALRAFRMFRGGSWCNIAEDCRSARRCFSDPTSLNGHIGFRLVLGREL